MRTKEEIFQGEDPIKFLLSCRMNFRKWCERVHGRNIADFHMEWFDAFYNYPSSCIEASRQHGKTEILAVDFFTWIAYFEKGKVMLVVSNSMEQSTTVMQRIKDAILDNELLTEIKSEDRDSVWSKTEMNFKTRCKIICKPYSDNMRSFTVDWALFDEGGTYRDKSIYYSAATPLVIAKKGHICVIGTPKTKIDLLAELSKSKHYKFIKTPALDSKGNPIWPWKYTKEALNIEREHIGNIRFNREYLCNPVSDEIAVFPYELIANGFLEDEILMPEGENGKNYYVGIDFAMSASYQGDFSVICVLEKNEDDRLKLVYMWREKGINPKVQSDKIKEVSEKFHPVKILADESSFGKTIIQDAIMMGVSIEGFKFQSQKEGLIDMLRARFDSKRLLIPVKPDHEMTKKMTDVLVQELTEITPYETPLGQTSYKGSGMHDDTVIALALAVRAAGMQRPILVSIGSAKVRIGNEFSDRMTGSIEEIGVGRGSIEDI